MINQLELHHLKTIQTIYQCRSIAIAAEKLNVSQQAVSLKLNKMRKIFGDQLFFRQGNSLTPTEYTEEIIPHVAKVLVDLNGIPLPEIMSLGKTHKTLTISATDYAQKVLINPLIKKLEKEAPNVQLIVCNIESSSLLQKMSLGDIDLAFTSYGYSPEGLLTTPIHTESYRCVSGDDSIADGKRISLNALVKYKFIITNPGLGNLKGSADAWFEKQNLSRTVAISSPSFEMTQQFLIDTKMVSFIPSRLLPSDGLYEIPLEKYPPGYEVIAVYHPRKKDDLLISWILQETKKLFSFV